MSVFFQDLKQALRGLRRQAWQAAISAVGLAVGVVCLAFSLNWLWTETHYDYFHPDYQDLYMLERGAETFRSSNMCWPVVEQLDTILGERGKYAAFRGMFGKDKCSLPEEPGNFFYMQCLQASPQIVDVLGAKVLSGSVEESLQTWDKFVITESMAKRIFGTTEAVGKPLLFTYNSGWQCTYTVGAVIEDNKEETNLSYDYIRFLDLSRSERTGWKNLNFHVLIRTKDTLAVGEGLKRIYRPDGEYDHFMLMPLRYYNKMGDGASFLEAYFYPLAFTCISLLLVLSALVNLIAVYTSIFLGRLREYALRCSLGASGWRNAGWMLTQVLPVLCLGVLLSGLFMEWIGNKGLVPGGMSHVGFFFWRVSAAVIVLVLAGMSYPFFKLRRAYQRSFSGVSGRGYFHGWLLVVQCFACAFLLFLSVGMQRQISEMIHTDLGYDHKNMLRLYTGWKTRVGQDAAFYYGNIFYDLPQAFRNESGSGITDAIAMRADLFNRVTGHTIDVLTEDQWSGWTGENVDNMQILRCDFMEVPFRAMEFFNIQVEGEGTMSAENDRKGVLQVVVNEEALSRMKSAGYEPGRKFYTGWRVGNSFCNTNSHKKDLHPIEGQPLMVQGMARLHLNDFHSEPRALMLIGVDERHECYYQEHDAVYIKYEPGRRDDAEAAVRRVLATFDVPEAAVDLTSFDEYIAESYKEETYYANLLTALTVFCVFVTLSGVVSMLLYSLRLRRRSMAIRRVMGAGFTDIFRPNLCKYAAFVLAGCLLAYFPAAVLIRKWMEYFYFGEVPGAGLMACILAGMWLVVSLIVWWNVRRSMDDRPMEVLQPES